MLTMSMTGADDLPMNATFSLSGTSGVFLKWDALSGAYVSVGATAESDGETVVWSDQAPIEGAKDPVLTIQIIDPQTQATMGSAQLILGVEGDGYRVSDYALTAN